MRVIEQQELAFSVEVHQPPEGIRVMVDGGLDLITAPHLEAVLGRVGVENGQPRCFWTLRVWDSWMRRDGGFWRGPLGRSRTEAAA